MASSVCTADSQSSLFGADGQELLPDSSSHGSQERLLGDRNSGVSTPSNPTFSSPSSLTHHDLTLANQTSTQETPPTPNYTPTSLPPSSKIVPSNSKNCNTQTYEIGSAHRCSTTFVASLLEPAHHTSPETTGRHGPKHQAMFEEFMKRLQSHPDPETGCESIAQELNTRNTNLFGKTEIKIRSYKDKKVWVEIDYESGPIARAVERTKPGAWGTSPARKK